MQYFYLRVSAIRRNRPPILEQTGQFDDDEQSRREYLEEVFSKRIDFVHRKSRLVYINLGADSDTVVSRLGREHTDVVNRPPDEQFEEEVLRTWRASNFFFRVTDDPNGQIISMQYRADVGYPPAIVESLVSFVNEVNADSKWVLEVVPMSNEQSFWDAVEAFGSEITSVQFSFVAPNILGLRSKLSEGLKDARDKNHARRVDITLSNPDGALDLDAENIKDAVDYASKGGGTAKLKVNKKVVYNSEQKKKVTKPEEDETVTHDNKTAWRRLMGQIFG